MFKFQRTFVLSIMVGCLCACGSSGTSGSPQQGGTQDGGGSSGNTCPKKPAASASNSIGASCPNGAGDCSTQFCVAVDPNQGPYCTQECSNGSCPQGYSCDAQTFAAFGITFCRQGSSGQSSSSAGSSAIPCKTDLECSCQQSGTVCGTFQGSSNCTIPCNTDADCQPTVGGIKSSFMTCQNDSTHNRKECLPNPACLANPLSCIQGP